MPRQSARLLACLLAAGSCGCISTARYVTLDPNGGVVAIPTNDNAWPTHHRDHAEALMRQRCPDGYVIEREGEFVTDTSEQTLTHTERTGDPILAALRIAPVTETVSQNTVHLERKEWRIWFRSKDVPPTPAAVEAPAPAPAAAEAPGPVPVSLRPPDTPPAQQPAVAVGGGDRPPDGPP